ncbi:MAG: hypothetical protein ABL873_09360 [Gallionella sp.]|nr:hypothetical protein [Gallionella sp.]
MKNDFVFWSLMIGTAGAFAAFIGGLLFLFINAKTKNRGDK